MDTTPSYLIHQLPEYEDAGYPPSIEYFLPVRDFPDADLNRLGPWLRSIAQSDEDAAARALAERWRPYRDGPLNGLAEHYLSFLPDLLYTQFRRRAWKRCGDSAKMFAWPFDFYSSNEFGG